MNINDFKEGDVITRVEKSAKGDGSWLGEEFIFVGVEKGIAFLLTTESYNEGGVYKMILRDGFDEGWDYYPLTLQAKAKALGAKLKEKLFGSK